MLPNPEAGRGVVTVVTELRAARAAGRVHAGDVAYLARAFGLSWTPAPFSRADRRRWEQALIGAQREDAAAARGPGARAAGGLDRAALTLPHRR